MKTTYVTRRGTRLLVALLLCFCSATPLFAQAFDGDSDNKMFLGYTNVGGLHGFELGYDQGINDYLSYGAKLTILKSKSGEEYDEMKFMDYADVALFLNYHWMETLKLPDSFDVFTGGIISFKTASLQTGARYNFGETFGVYCSAQYNFFETLSPSRAAKVFPEKFAFSAGLTISF